MAEEIKKNYYSATVAVVAIIIIIILAVLLYYFTAKEVSLTSTNLASVSNLPQQVEPTKVVEFGPSEILPTEIKSGHCFTNSIAEPYRQDAFRCSVGNLIYDPCFKTKEENFVFCQPNPLMPSAFLIKLEKPLPQVSVPAEIQNNWAWFVKLKNGIYCSPFTGTRPFFESEQGVLIAYYACNSENSDQQIVLMGNLTVGKVWIANKAVLEKSDENWIIKSTEKVEVETVWK